MQCLITFVTKRARGGTVNKDNLVNADVVRFGRATDCEVHLPDPRIALRQVELHLREGGLFIESLTGTDLTVNGAIVRSALVHPGDKLAIGPYDVTINPPKAGIDAAVSIEMARPLSDDLAQLHERSRVSLGATALSKRGLSWSLFVLVVLLFLVAPVVAYLSPGAREATKTWPIKADTAWNSGEISNAHKFFSGDCGACHQKAFVPVEDKACIACHKTIEQHADPKSFQMADLHKFGCQSCHKEHEGSHPIVLSNQQFCVQCHESLATLAPKTALLNTADFGRAHPEFRPSVVTGPGEIKRVSLADKPQERSGLIFPHDKHLVPEGVRSPNGRMKMDCGHCHVPEPGGRLMMPVKMEPMCDGCHLLKFEPTRLDWVLPHGRPADVIRLVRGLYDGLALRGGVEDPAAPAAVRRRPGTPLSEPERLDALAWAEKRSNDMMPIVFGRTVCGACHVAKPDTATPGSFVIEKPQVAQRWLPKGAFPHDRHATMVCGDCHQATKSASSEDVLLPPIAVCQNCHTGAASASNKISSTCVSCHKFHLRELGPMFDAASMTGLRTQ
ncbi:MAG: hypothetical protein FJX35_18520 [Alphaproteobacteria bacterium]|nr:hypothetical protein [Alphaproteobacteria bacterium]